MVKIFAKWIPAGEPESKFNKDGTKKDNAVKIHQSSNN